LGEQIRSLKASLKVCTGLALVATIEGGDGGFSLIKIIAGMHRPIDKREIIDINTVKRALASLN
jgi:hypothetical protein